jgi:pyruvate dehydrogenase E1 component alpha subunit
VERARAGSGPTLVECKTYKWMGHYIGDPANYRPKDEVAGWKARDPIPRFERRMLNSGIMTQEEIDAAHAAVRAEVEAAVEFARQSPLPRPEAALEDFNA